MLGILSACWDLVTGLLLSVWSIITLVATWGWEVLFYLHTTAPRLEGLVVGVLLTWLLLRREKHPVIRVISAPLKLVLDILDLSWDWCAEVAGDVWEAVSGTISKVATKATGLLRTTGSWIMTKLTGLRDKLRKPE